MLVVVATSLFFINVIAMNEAQRSEDLNVIAMNGAQRSEEAICQALCAL